MGMDAELRQTAAPDCHECGLPVQRVEQQWVATPDGWHPGAWHMICPEGHRVEVEPDYDPGHG